MEEEGEAGDGTLKGDLKGMNPTLLPCLDENSSEESYGEHQHAQDFLGSEDPIAAVWLPADLTCKHLSISSNREKKCCGRQEQYKTY